MSKTKTELKKEYKNVWSTYSQEDKNALFAYGERYRQFISNNKTERECVYDMIQKAEQAGYQNLETVIAQGGSLKAGDKVYAHYNHKTLLMFCMGQKPMTEGMNLLGAHLDSPRLDLKPNPLYEDTEFAMLKTHYYGGVKKYQWVTMPLAIHGVVAKKDGSVVSVVIGEAPTDPVVGISDLLIHLAGEQMEKKIKEAITGEDLNICLGSIPLEGEEKDKVKAHILMLLHDKYGMTEEDFVSAELEIVPAGMARDYGLDRSMIIGYGQDDRVCGYASFEAQLEVQNPERTTATILVDKEEIGSVGASGMHSRFFENMVSEVMDRAGCYSSLNLKRCLSRSKMLSSDVTAGYDPNYASVLEKNNAAYFGKRCCVYEIYRL